MRKSRKGGGAEKPQYRRGKRQWRRKYARSDGWLQLGQICRASVSPGIAQRRRQTPTCSSRTSLATCKGTDLLARCHPIHSHQWCNMLDAKVLMCYMPQVWIWEKTKFLNALWKRLRVWGKTPNKIEICTYKYIHIYIYTYIHIDTYIYMRIHTYICVYIRIYWYAWTNIRDSVPSPGFRWPVYNCVAYTLVCIHIYIYIYVYIHIHILCTFINIFIREYMYTYLYVCICTYMHIDMYIYMCVHMYLCVYIHILICMNEFTRRCPFTGTQMARLQSCSVYSCTHIYMYVCIRIHIYVCTHIHIFIQEYMYIYIFMYVYVHIWITYICIYTRTVGLPGKGYLYACEGPLTRTLPTKSWGWSPTILYVVVRARLDIHM